MLTVLAAFAGAWQENTLPSTKDDVVADIARRLNAKETAAIRDFEAAGRACLAELSADALAGIKIAAVSWAASGKASAPAIESDQVQAPFYSKAESFDGPTCTPSKPSGETVVEQDATFGGEEPEENCGGFDQNSVQRMFEQFDVDGDGLIDLEDFEQVLQRLGVEEIFGADQIPSLAKTADANGDGFIDIQEFSVWLRSFGETTSSSGEAAAEDTDVKQEEQELRSLLGRLQERLRKANLRATAAETQLSDAKSEHALELQRAEERFNKEEKILEEQATAALQFWRMVAGTSSSATLGKAVDMSAIEIIGSGRYSYVVKSSRVADGRPVVAKLLSLRWAHVAMNEWYVAQIIGEHPHVLKAELDDVWLHSDEQQYVAKLILSAIKDGTLKSKGRAQLPTHFVGLLYEFMECGTVQKWMDEDRLYPGGLLTVMQQTASALTHMHKHGISHNDVKPANLLLTREDPNDPNSNVILKLADLGLGAKSSDHSKDISQFVMTVYCMATGERFGAQKLNTMTNSLGQLRPELVDSFVSSLTQLTSSLASGNTSFPASPSLPCAAAAAEGTGVGRRRVHMALAELPTLVRRLCDGGMSMAEVRDSPWLDGWSFSDGDPSD